MARIYCNRTTAEAFELVFEGFFTSVEKATGRPLLFRVFNPSGSLLSINVDMEAAQVQGLGRALLRLNNPAISGIYESDPDILVQYVLKECVVHYER